MQAIQTRYLGPTNHRPSRIRVFTEGFPRGIVIAWDHALDVESNHRAAIATFIRAREWHGAWVVGSTATGYVATCLRSTFGVELLP